MGTAIWRGLRAVSAMRRSASGIRAPAHRAWGRAPSANGAGSAVAVGDAARAQRRDRRRRVTLDAHLEDLPAEAREQRLRGVERGDLAEVHDRDAVAQPLGLVEVVGGQQDRHVVPGAQARDDVEQLVADPRIQADGRLVEEEHARRGDQRAGDLQPAALTAAVAAHRAVDERAQAERLDELGDTACSAR